MSLKSFINQRNLSRYKKLVQEINKHYQIIQHYEQKELVEALDNLTNNPSLSLKHKTIQAMAIAKRAAQIVLGMTYYDVQLMGALALVDGAMAEMKTGEGKTLTCSASVIANYVLGYRTHVATANDYLAARDEEQLRKLYSFLGLTSSSNISSMQKEQKKEAYLCDVLYSTAQELGFDFLRDNLVYTPEEKIQPLDFNKVKCIIDEADFILIDEARTPLIISGESPLKDKDVYYKIRDIVQHFTVIDSDPNDISRFEEVIENGDIWLDRKQYNAFFSEHGYDKLERLSLAAGLLIEPEHYNKNAHILYHDYNSWITHEAINAIKAKYLYIRDKDYVVQNNEIVIVDPNTGRLSNGRTWSNGLHQAIEAKENLDIHPENMTLGSISIQNYFRNYGQISGMSGTIMQSSEEFEEIYNCKTIQIPTNKPVVRHEYQDRIYLNQKAKYQFMIEDILARHNKGQPILIGTVSVAESEIISNLLEQQQIQHYVLNAKNNALEAQIIAQAGQPGRVTVSTSMAGRGTDIILGGNKDNILELLKQQIQYVEERISYATQITEQLNIDLAIQIDLETIKNHITLDTAKNHSDITELYDNELFAQYVVGQPEFIWNRLYQLKFSLEQQLAILEKDWESWRQHVIDVGGLCVIGSSRNESRRIDDQLKGRSGRQGDPGECMFYMSLEDPWVNVFGKSALFAHLIKTLPEDQLISSPSISKVFAKAQRNIESHHFNIRKNTYQYDSIADEGRKKFLGIRNELLFEQNNVKHMLQAKLMEDLSILATEDFISYMEEIQQQDKINIESILALDLEELYEHINNYLQHEYYGLSNEQHSKKYLPLLEEKINQLILEQEDYVWSELHSITMKELDHNWSHHLSYIDEAQRNVGFSSLAQKNPIYEYKKICFQSFSNMLDSLKQKMIHEFIQVNQKNKEMELEKEIAIS